MNRIFGWIYCLDLSAAAMLALLGTALFLLLRTVFSSRGWWKWAQITGLLLWLAAVAYLTVLRREPGDPQSAAFLPPFASYLEVLQGGRKELLRSNFMNVLMFYPAGLLSCGLLPSRWKCTTKIVFLSAAAFGLSTGIECVQYFCGLGLGEWDDMLHNALGAVLSAGVCCLRFPRSKPMTTVTENQYTLLHILAHALRNTKPDAATLPEGTDWNALLRTSGQHKLLPLIVSALPVSEIPEAAAMKRTAIQQTVSQTLRTSAFLELYRSMEDAGFHPLVVKGILCRSLYPQGDLRPSSDEDLLVPHSEFEACCSFLRDYGMTPTGEITPQSFETGWRNDTLYIELHRSLFSPEAGAYGDLNRFFENAAEQAQTYPTEQGSSVRSLIPQDHMLYLLLHAYKHFLHSGFGIRQICDIGLWARKYHGQIQWEELAEKCRSSNAFGFAAAVFSIAEHYLDIPLNLPASWNCEKSYCEPLLADVLSGGIYGSADSSRQHSATVTLNAVEANRTGSRPSVFASLFPGRSYMEAKYPYLKKYPLLLPLAWCQRLLRYLKEHRKDPAASADIGRERVDLLKFYGIIR